MVGSVEKSSCGKTHIVEESLKEFATVESLKCSVAVATYKTIKDVFFALVLVAPVRNNTMEMEVAVPFVAVLHKLRKDIIAFSIDLFFK